MPGYLLIWNPDQWPWSNRKEEAQRVRDGGTINTYWSSGVRKNLPPGSRLFLMRKGKRPRGLVGSGWSTRPLVSREHWGEKDKSVLYVPLRFDALIVPPDSGKDEDEDEDEKLLRVDDLQAAIPNDVVNWDTPGGGIEIKDEALEVLERLWAEHLLRIGYWPPTERLSQERPLQLVRRKARDAGFSRLVRAMGGGRCAVCPPAMQYEAVGILETAHIRAVEANGPDELANALALCPNHHALFDEGFWTVEQGRLVFSAALPEALRGTFAEMLTCGWALAPEHLEWHRRERFRP